MEVEIINLTNDNINQTSLVQWVMRIQKELITLDISSTKLKKELTIAFVDELAMRKLNQQFRKKNSVTDILSFAPTTNSSLGELVLCLPYISANKKEINVSEWLYYLILHGILHLLGFEHEQGGSQAKQMFQLQDRVFEKLMRGKK